MPAADTHLPLPQPFFWNKLPPASVTASVWGDIDSVPALDLTDLERDFGVGSPARAVVKKAPAASKKQATTLLGIARAQNIGSFPFISLAVILAWLSRF